MCKRPTPLSVAVSEVFPVLTQLNLFGSLSEFLEMLFLVSLLLSSILELTSFVTKGSVHTRMTEIRRLHSSIWFPSLRTKSEWVALTSSGNLVPPLTSPDVCKPKSQWRYGKNEHQVFGDTGVRVSVVVVTLYQLSRLRRLWTTKIEK